MKNVLVTGGAGYIGSHAVVELILSGKNVVIIDNYSNSSPSVFAKIKELTGVLPDHYCVDLCDIDQIAMIFQQYEFDEVLHFAGLKSVGESVTQPLAYFDNNVVGSLNLLKIMAKFGCYNLVFSSSATVYGGMSSSPIEEDSPLLAINPYGESKLMIENVLRHLSTSDANWKIVILRYFNPVAAHPTGLIGESPKGVPNNLMPYIAKVAMGHLEYLPIFGDDYPTEDGTGVRDYIHVVDLVRAHLLALGSLSSRQGCHCYNIGTGVGYSVLEMVAAFERACGKKVPYKVLPRRKGDVAVCYADPSLSRQELGWEAVYDLDKMMIDQWSWQNKNIELGG
jgi:UDP-glucose 4-epimerase